MAIVKYETSGAIAVLTIDRPQALNALNTQALSELNEVLDQVDVKTVRCMIVRGSGDRAFAAGADIAQMRDLNNEDARRFGRMGSAVFRKLERLSVPTIAQISGYTLGGGCELAMCCDIRLCAENAVFGQPEVSLGITPGFGGTQRLARLVGMGMAKQMLYTARSIDAKEAYRIGLVNAVYPLEELGEAVMEMAKQIAANAPIAVRAVKRAINEGMQVDIDRGTAIEEAEFGSCFNTEDQREGMGAFLEKRKHGPFANN